MESILGNSRRPDVTFYRDGRIDITSRVARMLQLTEGDVVDIGLHQDEYYLYVRTRGKDVVGKHSAQCFASKKNSCNYRAYCRKICAAILGSSEIARVPAGDAVELPQIGIAVPLIVRLNLA